MLKTIGKITSSHGLKGEVKVIYDSDFNRLYKGNTLYVKLDDYIPLVINSVKFVKNNLYYVTFKDHLDINLIEKYLHHDLYVNASEEDLEEGEYFYSDLIGKEVFNEENIFRGIVKDVKRYPSCDMLEVLVDNKKKLIPFIDEFIKDVKDNKIIIKEIEGLL